MIRWESLDLSVASPEQVDTFIDTASPAKLTQQSGVVWIVVGFTGETLAQVVESLDAAMSTEFCNSIKLGLVTKDHLLRIGLRHGKISGRWTFFLRRPDPETHQFWAKLVRSMCDGSMSSPMAKISTKNCELGKANQVAYVCVENFLDIQAVLKVERELRALGVSENMYFKPDVFSNLGIYQNNPWKVKPYIYYSRFDAAQGASSFALV